MAFNIITNGDNRVVRHIAQIVDSIQLPSYKWFSLHSNKLDGSYHPVDTTGSFQIGWWGNKLSDEDGYIEEQIITVQGVNSIHGLTVVGDTLEDNYPVDFVISIYNGATELYTKTVTQNSEVVWQFDLDAVYDITSMTITISRISKPYAVAKILDVIGPSILYSTDTLVLIAQEESGIKDKIKIVLNESSFIQIQNISLESLRLKDTTRVVTHRVEAPGVDALKVQGQETHKHIVIITQPTDLLAISMTERSKVTNVHSRMDGSLRQVFGKVEITYAAPFLSDNMEITASQIGRYTKPSGVADNVSLSEYKWASLHDNKLDGSYHPMPEVTSRKYHVGLWGTELSDSQGRLASKPTITINFIPRPIYYLKLSGDDKLGNYPVDFDIDVYDINNTILYSEHIVNNTSNQWYKDLNPIISGVTKIRLTVNAISKPQQVFKITEFFNSIVETYYNKQIVNMHLLEELDYVESSITLGAVSSNEIDIVLDNSQGTFNIMDTTKPLYNLIKRNRKVRAWLGVEVIENAIEWYPLGTFYTTKWNIPDRSLTASLTARDILDVLNYSDFSNSEVYMNNSLGALYAIILGDAGLQEGVDYIIDSSLYNIIIPYAWFAKMSHRAALQRLSGCVLTQLYCDRDGIINITNMQPTNTTFFTYKDSTNVISKDYPFVWNEITNYVEVAANMYVEGDTKKILEAKESITIPALGSVQLQYEFNTSPVVRTDAPILTADAGVAIKNYSIYSTGMIIELENITGISKQVTAIDVNGIALEKQTTAICVAKDEALIKENGMLKTTIQHDFIQSTAYAQQLANSLLTGYMESKYDVKLTCRGNIGVYLKHKVQVEDMRLNETKQYVVKRQAIDWNGALSAVTECKKLD